MRIIALKTIKLFWEVQPSAEQALKAWYFEMQEATFLNPHELKERFRNASIVNSNRIVFNIHGNKYRLVVDIEYRLQLIFIVWLGTHSEYDKIDVKNVEFKKYN